MTFKFPEYSYKILCPDSSVFNIAGESKSYHRNRKKKINLAVMSVFSGIWKVKFQFF